LIPAGIVAFVVYLLWVAGIGLLVIALALIAIVALLVRMLIGC
jgi:hypothetical protein